MKVKWGVIGAGGIARRRTIPELVRLADNAALVCVMDSQADLAREVAEQFAVPHWCSTEAELLAQDVDAVYVASPAYAHCAQVVQAAQAGKHILCEKPMALTVAEAAEMETDCIAAGVTFMTAFSMRYNPYNRQARELVQSGALGQMVMGRAELTCWYPPIEGAWRQDLALGGGGAFIDLGNHCFDLLEWIMGAEVVEVAGFSDRMTHAYATEVDDATTVVARLSNGAHALVDTYFNVPDAAAQNALELYGTQGCAIAQGTIGQTPGGRMFSVLEGQGAYDAQQARETPAARQEYHLEGAGNYGEMVRDFSDCLLSGREPLVPLAEGRHSVALVEAAYRAARERRVVCVAEVEAGYSPGGAGAALAPRRQPQEE